MDKAIHSYKNLHAWKQAKLLCVELPLELNYLPINIIKNEILQASMKAH